MLAAGIIHRVEGCDRATDTGQFEGQKHADRVRRRAHGDYVWETGKFGNAPEVGLETWFIRGGSAGAALYKFQQPGIYAYVTHNLIEAANLGATAHFKVEGKWNDDLMTQVKAPAEIPAPKTN